jgi:uncharacterized protein
VILSDEFTVDAPIDQIWRTMMDVERVAACLPGAKIEPVGEDGTHRGALKVKVGPVTMSYEGTVRLEDVDDANWTLSYHASAREASGTGSAAATIRARLTPGNGDARTRVDVETDLNVTGRAAQFGRGIMHSVASKMIGAFADELQKLIAEGRSAGLGPGDAVSQSIGESERTDEARTETSQPAQSGVESLDFGAMLFSTVPPAAVAAVGIALVLGYALGRRDRKVQVVVALPQRGNEAPAV